MELGWSHGVWGVCKVFIPLWTLLNSTSNASLGILSLISICIFCVCARVSCVRTCAYVVRESGYVGGLLHSGLPWFEELGPFL